MIADIKAKVDQFDPTILSEGDNEMPRMTKLGELFTVGWQSRLVLAGKAYRWNFGTISGAADITMVGDGTAIELERPEGILAIDSGFIVPMGLNFGITSVADAAADEVDFLLTADRATAVSAADLATAVGVADSTINLLDGAPAFSGRAIQTATVDITDPVHSDVLYYKHWLGVGTAVEVLDLNVVHEWAYPQFIAGPCSILLYIGGTLAPTTVGSIVFAHIPASWVPVS